MVKKEFKETYKNNSAMPKWLINPEVESELDAVQKFSASDGRSLLDSMGEVIVTNHLTNLKAIYGQWSEFILVDFGAISLELGYEGDDFKKGIQRIRAILCCDFILDRKEGFQQITISR